MDPVDLATRVTTTTEGEGMNGSINSSARRQRPIVARLCWSWIACLCLIGTVGCRSEAQSPAPTPRQLGQVLPLEAEVHIGDQRFQLEVARTPPQQQLGLMFRESMPADQGMLFPFDPPQPAAFWMYNTRIPLDIIFVYQEKVVYLAANVPGCPQQPCPSYGPAVTQLVDQVVELNGGTAAKLGLQVGDEIDVTLLPSR
jgi:hypothetical protein